MRPENNYRCSFKTWHDRNFSGCESIASYYFNEIAASANTIGVNWHLVSNRVYWDTDGIKLNTTRSELIKGCKKTVGIYLCKKRDKNNIEYPFITFKNKGGAGDTVIFNAKELLWSEYKSTAYNQTSGITLRSMCDRQVRIQNNRKTAAQHYEKAKGLMKMEESKKLLNVRMELTAFNKAGQVRGCFNYLVSKQIKSICGLCDLRYNTDKYGSFMCFKICKLTSDGRSLVPLGVQKIYKTSIKKFTWGMQKAGGFFYIGSLKEAEYIFICEGFATGASIYLALQRSDACVIVALDAHNLVKVYDSFAKILNNKKLIACLDNDFMSENHNAGFKSGRDITEVYPDARLCYPDFSNMVDSLASDKKVSDFNDLHILGGLKEVKKQIMFCLANQKKIDIN